MPGSALRGDRPQQVGAVTGAGIQYTAQTEPGKTNYLAVRAGNSVVVDQAEGINIRDITDGTSRTIALVEADDDRAVIWTKPDDLSWQADAPSAGLCGLYPGGHFLAAFADGHVEVVSKWVDAKTLIAAFTRNGNEPLPAGALQKDER